MSAVINNMNAAPSLLVNQVRNSNHWIAIHAVGTKSNRDGIGARIRVKTATRILVDEVRSGSSYISNSDMRVHFGLGKSDEDRMGRDSLAERLDGSFRVCRSIRSDVRMLREPLHEPR